MIYEFLIVLTICSYGRSCGSVTSAHQSSTSANSHMGGYGSGLSSTGSHGTGKCDRNKMESQFLNNVSIIIVMHDNEC